MTIFLLLQMQAQIQETKSTPVSYDVDFASIEVQQGGEEVRLLKLFFPERFTAPGSDYEALKLVGAPSQSYFTHFSYFSLKLLLRKVILPTSPTSHPTDLDAREAGTE